jgi:hypothetical protein
MQERNRSKVGRMARLRGHFERAEAADPAVKDPSPATSAKSPTEATAEFMRKSGAPEEDIQAFINSQKGR